MEEMEEGKGQKHRDRRKQRRSCFTEESSSSEMKEEMPQRERSRGPRWKSVAKLSIQDAG